MDDRDDAGDPGTAVFETGVREGVVRIARPGATWLSTGWEGGRTRADAVHSVSVPEGWECDSIGDYVDRRLARAGFRREGPVLLTGVDADHARRARCGPVEAVATAGVSNPAALPADPGAEPREPDPVDGTAGSSGSAEGEDPPGTVNVVVGTTRDLAPGALANLVAVAAEAKTATLLDAAGVPGTTTDAVVVAADPDGEPAEYSGSGTVVGAAARACVREAVRASLDSRYPDGPPAPADAEHATRTDARASVSRPGERPTDHD